MSDGTLRGVMNKYNFLENLPEKCPGLYDKNVLHDIQRLAKDTNYSRKMIRDYLNQKYNLNILSDGSLRGVMNKYNFEENLPEKCPGLHDPNVQKDLKRLAKDKNFSRKMIRD